MKFGPSFVAGALGLVAVGVAAPASAYKDGCYRDSYGNCYFAPLSLATVLESPADRAAYGTTPDQHFAYFVTHNDDAPEFTITNFPLLRSQGIGACQQEDAGATPMQAVYSLDRRYGGPYSFEVANAITSAAETIYCPWHGAASKQDVEESRPVYPPPVYPPLGYPPATRVMIRKTFAARCVAAG